MLFSTTMLPPALVSLGYQDGALYSFLSTFGLTLITGLVLQYSGFEPNQVQSEETVSAIRAIFGLLPAACYVMGGLLFTRFAFNEAEHAAARAAIEQRANP